VLKVAVATTVRELVATALAVRDTINEPLTVLEPVDVLDALGEPVCVIDALTLGVCVAEIDGERDTAGEGVDDLDTRAEAEYETVPHEDAVLVSVKFDEPDTVPDVLPVAVIVSVPK